MTFSVSSTAVEWGLYIHWPFCESKCPYCDFNSHVRPHVDHERWCCALLQELEHMAQHTSLGTLKSIFFGGGTPSLMDPKTVHALIDKAAALWSVDPAIEITLEANPSSVEGKKLVEFRRAGVNRLSIGVQSLYESDLKFLGRRHSRDEALSVLKTAYKHFDKFSFDLIYGRPQQTLKGWSQELLEALTYAQGHLSVYQLTIEEGTAFYHAHKRGDFHLPDEEMAACFYELTQDILQDHHMPAYEVSNHARMGHESQHNLIYWRYGTFGAIGPGAHGRLMTPKGFEALKRLKAPETWLNAVETQGHGTDTSIPLSKDEQFIEALMMGMRLIEGVNLSCLKRVQPLATLQLLESQILKDLQQEGLIVKEETYLKATPRGLLCLNSLTQMLIQGAHL